MRDRFEELLADPCCTSCDCDGLALDVAAYLDHKSCDAERCRQRDQQQPPVDPAAKENRPKG